MITDMFGMPIKSGDSVVTEQFDLGVVTKLLDPFTAQVYVNGIHNVPILIRELCSVYPLKLEAGDTSKYVLFDVLNRELRCGSEVLYPMVSSGIAIGTVTEIDTDSSLLSVQDGQKVTYRHHWELLIIDERIKYLEEEYPELIL